MAHMSGANAHVIIAKTRDDSRIIAEFVSSSVLVKVLISEPDSEGEFRRLLQRFTFTLAGHTIQRFELDGYDAHSLVAAPFRIICRQINDRVPIRHIIDDYGVYIFEPSPPTPQPAPPMQPMNNSQLHRMPQINQITSMTPMNQTAINLFTQLGQMASALYRTGHPMRQHTDQPIQPSQSSQSSQPQPNQPDDPPPRFVENRHGVNREIILSSAIPTPAVQNTEETQNIIGLQSPAHARAVVSAQVIKQISATIKNKINTRRIAAPSFTKKTRANYSKIKNFIHHHTNIWLSKAEIDMFIFEMTEQ